LQRPGRCGSVGVRYPDLDSARAGRIREPVYAHAQSFARCAAIAILRPKAVF